MASRILIVDDDVDFTRLLSARLMANNYEVVTAFDAITAISTALKHRPHLVILDIRLPAGGGFRVYANLRASMRTSRIPVLFVTGFDQVGAGREKKVRDSLQALGRPFLLKPFVAEELLEQVKQALQNPLGAPDPDESAMIKEIIDQLSQN